MLYEVITAPVPLYMKPGPEFPWGLSGPALELAAEVGNVLVAKTGGDGLYRRITSYNVCYTKLLRKSGSPIRNIYP